MKAYLLLLRVPGVLRITAAQLFARIPLGMMNLAILLHVESLTGSYGVAGAVVAAMSLGEAVAMPLTSRLAGAVGARRVLVAAALVNACALVLLVVSAPEPLLLAVLGLLVGGSVPPLMPVVRALYPRLVPRRSIPALFALDTTAQELIWVIGPLLATVLATAISTGVPLLACAGITIVGTVWLITSPYFRRFRLERNTLPFGRGLFHGSVVLAMVSSFGLVASFMALEVGIVAHFEDDGLLVGLAIAVASIGSLVGGLSLGHRRLGVPGVVAALGGVAVGTAVAGSAQNLTLMLIALFLSGLGFAPALAALYLMVSRVVDQSAAAEVYGWLTTGSLVGGAVGTALGGVMSDLVGASGAFVAAAVLAVATALTPAVARLRGPIAGLSPAAPSPRPEAIS